MDHLNLRVLFRCLESEQLVHIDGSPLEQVAQDSVNEL